MTYIICDVLYQNHEMDAEARCFLRHIPQSHDPIGVILIIFFAAGSLVALFPLNFQPTICLLLPNDLDIWLNFGFPFPCIAIISSFAGHIPCFVGKTSFICNLQLVWTFLVGDKRIANPILLGFSNFCWWSDPLAHCSFLVKIPGHGLGWSTRSYFCWVTHEFWMVNSLDVSNLWRYT